MKMEQRGDGIVVVTFTSTSDGNYLTSRQIKEFAVTLDTVIATPGLKAVVLSGEGADFCCGRIGAKGLTAAADIRDDLNLILEVNARLRSSPVPFIAAVEGRAFGFGCGFSTQCDITIAGESARFALPEMSHQLPPLIVLSYFGKFVPFKKAFELALTSRQFDAQEAERIGIVTQIVPAGNALSRAMVLAQTIAKLDAEAVRLLREFARRVGGLSDDHEARNGMASMALMMSARAAREAATT
jgi:enoyl-CoA hydratase/carnithine racemase